MSEGPGPIAEARPDEPVPQENNGNADALHSPLSPETHPASSQDESKQDEPMQEDPTSVKESGTGGIKRQSSQDSHEDDEERAAKRVKENHTDAVDHSTSNGVPADDAPSPDTAHAPGPPKDSGSPAASPAHALTSEPPSSQPEPETPQASNQPLPNGNAPVTYLPGSFQPPYREPFGPTSPITGQQCRSLIAIIKQIKKTREAVPFNTAVDPIAFNIPHYANIIKRPMDLTTVETKLNASNPSPPKDKNRPVKKDMSLGTYANVQEVVEDVRQIWNNTRIFNGPHHAVSLNANKLDDMFENAIQKAKLGEDTSARRASISQAPAIQRNNSNDHGDSSRPKREIHPPTPKDSTWVAEQSTSKRKGRPSEDEKIRAVSKILEELMYRKQYMEMVGAFLYPVDPVALNIPDYPTIIKKPMDMSTIQSRINQHYYSTAQQIFDDFKLMLNNCFTYNPPGTPVHEAGRALERAWQEKWNNMAILHAKPDADEEEDEFAGVDVEGEIRSLERQVADMQSRLGRLRAYRTKHHEKARAKATAAASHAKSHKATGNAHASSSKNTKAKTAASHKPAASKTKRQSTSNGTAHTKKGAGTAYNYDDEEDDYEQEAPVTVTLAQKQELADKIGEVDHTTLQSALEIISKTTSVQDGNDEIELDIDALPANTVYQLYNLVVLGYPNGQPPKKKKGAAASHKRGAGAATGAAKRAGGGGGGRSKQNGNEKDRIRALEAQLASLERQPGDGDDDDGDNSSVAYSEEDSDEE